MKILGRAKDVLYIPNHIPMDMLSEAMAQKNHGQSLKGLDDRGGLSVMEILANLKNDRIVRGTETQKDVDELNDLIKKHKLSSIKSEVINFALEAVARHAVQGTINGEPVYEFEDKWITIDELFDEFFKP